MSDARPARSRRQRVMAVVRILFIVLAIGLAVGYLVPRGDALAAGFAQLTPQRVVVSVLAAVLALGMNGIAWLGLVRSGRTPLPAVDGLRLYFLTQLGKYVPGGVWPYLAQAEFARARGMRPRRTVVLGLITLVISALMALTLALGLLPLTLPAWWPLALLAVLPVAFVVATPPDAAEELLARGMRRLGRSWESEPLTRRDVIVCALWSLLSWPFWGIHLAALLPTPPTPVELLQSTGIYAAAWIVGFALVFLPAGVVGREGMLVLLLGAAGVASSHAVTAALLSRGIATVADLLIAAAAVGVAALARGRSPRPPASA